MDKNYFFKDLLKVVFVLWGEEWEYLVWKFFFYYLYFVVVFLIEYVYFFINLKLI